MPKNKDKEKLIKDIKKSVKAGKFSPFMTISGINEIMGEIDNKCGNCNFNLLCRRGFIGGGD